MIHLLYEIALWVAAIVFLPYHYGRSFQRSRPAALAERFGAVPEGDLALLTGERPIWVHAVSVGETIAVKPLLTALRNRYPTRKIVVSNGTETGRSVALQLAEVDLCLYFPFDFRFATRRLLGSIRPALILVVETEIWPNFMRTARKMEIPVVMVNGRISDRSFGRYLRLRWFFARILNDFSRFCMQSGEDARRITAMGALPERVTVARNLKYDLAVTPLTPLERETAKNNRRIPDGVPVFTAGSTHQGEEQAVLSAYRQLIAEGRQLFLVLAPRHPERVAEVTELLRQQQLPFALCSQSGARLAAGEVLVIDTIGELTSFYALSNLVFVGGSLVPTGGHNILEPAAFRVPVLFGPHMSNFREAASLLLACGGGLQVQDGVELATSLARLLDDEAQRRAMGANGARLLEENSGSTRLHLGVVESLLEGC